MRKPLVEVINVKKYFPILRGVIRQRQLGSVRAVDGVSFQINQAETLGLVGESGCGKTTLGRLTLRLLEPSEGQVHFQGKDLFSLSKRELRQVRRHMQMIFQDPFSSLSPRLSITETIAEPLDVHNMAQGSERQDRVVEMMKAVGLRPEDGGRYPHEFSGGQRQRIAIARAVVLNPQFVVADEPVSALDASIQSQILNLLQDLQEEYDLAYLFIAHDLNVVYHMSDRILVMYLGRVVESAPATELFDNPLHPYTQALISAVPDITGEKESERIILRGSVPSPANLPPGCRFHTRCLECYVMETCHSEEPPLVHVGNDHWVACFLHE